MKLLMLSEEWDLSGSEVFGDERQVIWLDIETRKVAQTDASWPGGGRQQSLRWQPFMVSMCGASDPGVFWADCFACEDEKDLVECVGEFRDYEIRYSATREFDEMVLRGRFTNARRAHASFPGPWPHVPDEMNFRNIRKSLRPADWVRAKDCESADVPHLWARGREEDRRVVALHCLRDSLELPLCDTEISLSSALRKKMKNVMEK